MQGSGPNREPRNNQEPDKWLQNKNTWGFLKLGVPFWGPHNKDHNILGSILGSPNFGKLPLSIQVRNPHVERLVARAV